jgi:transposase InsO family protein
LLYQKKLQKYGLIPSMSGKGNCYDNASVKTFFKTIKAELIWPTRRQAETAICHYINGFYNQRHGRSRNELGDRNQTVTSPLIITVDFCRSPGISVNP